MEVRRFPKEFPSKTPVAELLPVPPPHWQTIVDASQNRLLV
jgi:hypothetical protein